MAANIGGVAIDLGMNSAAFQRDVAAATNALKAEATKMRIAMRNIERAANSVERQFAQLKSGALALGGALAVREFGRFAKQAIDSASAIHDTAEAVGLSTTALQEFRIAAGLSGVGMEKFDASLGRFVGNLGEARKGSGTLFAALKDTDKAFLKQIQTAGTTEQALNLIFRRMADIKDPAERAAFAVAAFGREGIKMTGIVRDGVGGLIDMRKQARELGLTLDKDLIGKAEALGDRLDLLKHAFETGVARSLIKQFADEFQLTNDNMEAAKRAGEEFGRVVGIAMKGVAEAAEFLGRNMREIVAAFAAFAAFKAAALFAGLAASVVKFAAVLRTAAVAQGALNLAMAANPALRIAAALAALAVAFDALGPASDRAVALTEELKLLDARIAELQQRKDMNLPLFGSADKNEAELQRLLAQRARVAGLLDGLRTAMTSGAGEETQPAPFSLPLNEDKLREATIALQSHNLGLEQLIATYGRAGMSGKALPDTVRDLQDALELENAAVKENVDLTTKQGAAWQAAFQANQGLKHSLEQTAKAYTDLRNAGEEASLAAARAQAAAIFDPEKRRAAELAIERQKEINELTRAYGTVADGTGQKLLQMWDAAAASREQIRFWDDVRAKAEDISKDVSQFLVDGLVNVDRAGRSVFQNMWEAASAGAKRFFADLAAEFLRQKFILPITAQLVGQMPGAFGIPQTGGTSSSSFGMIGDLIGGLFGSSGGGSEAQAIGQMFAGSGFAHGTDSAPPGWAWTGEEGPELVRFRGGETVVPHDESMQVVGGRGAVVNMTIKTPDTDSFRRSLRQIARQAREKFGE